MDNQTQEEVGKMQDEEAMFPPKRNFKEVDIGAFNRQDSKERFPPKADSPPERPATARWRLNLCALSQRFNLYFVVCGDEIHVTTPKNVNHKLPGQPDARIPIPQTVGEGMTGGHIDQEHPHYANHIICGNLGSEEIILLSCDDGDVVAFYTFAIYNRIKALGTTLGESPVLDIKPLFHSNVGISAWGLAIHQKSRLIAVSTNNHEVQLFGFATRSKSPLYGEEGVYVETQLSSELFEDLGPISPLSADDQRYNGYRFVYQMGQRAHNIPSITFVSNEDGDAEMILASDIVGHLWQVKLWGTRRQDRAELLSGTGPYDGEWGWCVLALPIDSFKCEQTPLKAFGIVDIVNAVSFMGDDQRVFVYVNESAFRIIDQTTGIRKNIPGMFSVEKLPADDSDTEHDHDEDETIMPIRSPTPYPSTRIEEIGFKVKEDDLNRKNEIFRYMVNVLPSGISEDGSLAAFIQDAKLRIHGEPLQLPKTDAQLKEPDHTPEGLEASKKRLPSGCAILRTYNRAIELIPPVSGIPNTIFTSVLQQPLGPRPPRPAHLERSHRLNMYAFIPELSLVVVASQAGEAVVISLTKLPRGFSKWGEIPLS
ncbi:hypothetical protein HYFRA_00005860 [Hymenoscyphus fraxineus]|uniref:Uncharacterized protein n=1 Tax=Hymenoscyphus fraxineus TaxID=746836 RepID=A0A9N9KY43_9HELO|nr:hypothetical protein HYFRA_00005860 [Hymenoscyphus fraxineus]